MSRFVFSVILINIFSKKVDVKVRSPSRHVGLCLTSIFIAFLTSETFLEVKNKTLYTFVKTLKTKRALARGEGLPEEVSAACLAVSLGKRNLTSHHLLPLPDSSVQHHLPLRSHHLGYDPQQDQDGQILK